ncbi:hypothetical protein CANARDRAFT_27181 [[Candida] arabinofermentans NRRL YB-2248]|uniref:Ubiquitin-like protein ATG12 n=1 Tax=[Candida] arabinofermentans NRRL YB-2248 TaxID=983967 RepID=A0A1E4T4W8_9ASCO|nr:hypothetical protein CANARDRAFT_27181 [[Candida] arabinofermentans NRRL YB-2248]
MSNRNKNLGLQKMSNLESSLMELNIRVGNNKDTATTILEENDSEKSSTEDTELNEDGGNTISNKPQKTKITLNQSILFSKLPPQTTSTILTVSKPVVSKIQIRFKSIGSVNQVKPAVFKISKSSKFASILKFLELKIGGKVYCYLSNSVSPNPDEELSNLYDIFKVGDELIVSYCNTVAFG